MTQETGEGCGISAPGRLMGSRGPVSDQNPGCELVPGGSGELSLSAEKAAAVNAGRGGTGVLSISDEETEKQSF